MPSHALGAAELPAAAVAAFRSRGLIRGTPRERPQTPEPISACQNQFGDHSVLTQLVQAHLFQKECWLVKCLFE